MNEPAPDLAVNHWTVACSRVTVPRTAWVVLFGGLVGWLASMTSTIERFKLFTDPSPTNGDASVVLLEQHRKHRGCEGVGSRYHQLSSRCSSNRLHGSRSAASSLTGNTAVIGSGSSAMRAATGCGRPPATGTADARRAVRSLISLM